MFRLQDNVIRIKAALVELVDNWNTYLGEAIRKSDKKKEKTAVPELESPASEVTEKPIVDLQKEVADIEKSKCVINKENAFYIFYSDTILGESIEDSSQTKQSDTSAVTTTTIEESTDNKREVIKKEKSVKNILDKLLPSSGQLNLIQVKNNLNFFKSILLTKNTIIESISFARTLQPPCWSVRANNSV